MVSHLHRGAARYSFSNRYHTSKVARAHCWLNDLTTGRVASMAVIGEREGVNKRYVSRLIRLGLLAPQIVEMTLKALARPNSPPSP
jgi:hypothetical protein